MPPSNRVTEINLAGAHLLLFQWHHPCSRQQPVDAAEDHSFRGSALQDVELMPERKDFGFQRSPRPE
jgi:hypothetical protein